MINQDLTLTRGSGAYSHAFDFANAVPPKQIEASQQWMLQITVNIAVKLIKLSAKVQDGGDDQIGLDPLTDHVTVYLSEKERNGIPDSGYSYKLYLYDATNESWDVMAYGNITSSGTAPVGVEITGVPWVNGNGITKLLANQTVYSANHLDDTIKSIPGTGVQTVIKLPPANTMVGKKITVHHNGAGTTKVTDFDDVQLVLLDSVGDSKLFLADNADENDWTAFYQ